jgi:hypothetical protein
MLAELVCLILSEKFSSKKRSTRYYQKGSWVLMQSPCYSLRDFNKNLIFTADFLEILKYQML